MGISFRLRFNAGLELSFNSDIPYPLSLEAYRSMGADKEWALKWIEGSIESYAGERTTMNILLGRIKRAMESHGVTKGEILAVVDAIERSPVYLPSLNPSEKTARLKPLKKALEDEL